MEGNLNRRQKNSHKWLTVILEGIPLLVIWLVLASVIFDFASFSFDLPVLYSGDSHLTMLVLKNTQESGGILTDTTRLGYPYQSSFAAFPVFFTEYVRTLIFDLISLFTSNTVAVFNIYLMIIPLLNLIIAYYVFRSMSIRPVYAYVGAAVFAFCYYFRFRNSGHDTLAGFYFVPLSFLLCFWCKEDKRLFQKDSVFTYYRNWLVLLFCFCIGGNGNGYYPFFACIILGITFLESAFSRNDWKSCMKYWIPIGFIVIFFAMANKLPILLGTIGEVDVSPDRLVSETEVYGLRIATMFSSPNGFFVSALKDKLAAERSGAILLNENISGYLGVFAILGLLSLFIMFIGSEKGETNSFDQRRRLLLKIVICLVLYGTIAGVGLLFSAIVTPKLRGLNRISIYISFACVLAMCLWLEHFTITKCNRRTTTILLAAVVVGVGIFDQADVFASAGKLSCENEKQSFMADKEYVEKIEDLAGQQGAVFQLPYCGFPEYNLDNVPPYHYLIFYIHSDVLSTAYGVGKGTDADKWYKQTAELPIEEMIEKLCYSGFSGISVDWRPYSPEEANLLRQELESRLGDAEVIHSNGQIAYYSIEDRKLELMEQDDYSLKRKAAALLTKWRGVYDREGTAQDGYWNWCKQDVSCSIEKLEDEIECEWSATIVPASDGGLTVVLPEGETQFFECRAWEPIEIQLHLRFTPENNGMTFHYDGIPVQTTADPREMYFQFLNLKDPQI